MWYLHTMEQYSALKQEILPRATTWISLEDLMLGEISQSSKDKYCIDFCEVLEQSDSYGQGKLMIAKGWGRGEKDGEFVFNGQFQFYVIEKHSGDGWW